MKLRPALNIAKGPAGVWLIDLATDKDRFVISIASCDGKRYSHLVMQSLAAHISESLPAIIEVPDE